MKKIKLLMALGVVVCMGLNGCSIATTKANTSTASSSSQSEDKQDNSEFQAVVNQNSSKFQQLSFKDPDTGATLEYDLYVPKDYDSSKSYPLLMYIPDETSIGKTPAELVQQYYGADIWVTDEDQSKHESFVLVPAFTERPVNDDWSTSNQIDTVVKLINNLKEQYSIDNNRVYSTGQSIGCSTSLYLSSNYNDLFAAYMFVSGQWDVSVLGGLENDKFFYITDEGDTKASGGQDEVMRMFYNNGVGYTYETWSAQEPLEAQNQDVQDMIAQGTNANMIRFQKGSVMQPGDTEMGSEATAADYAYRLSSIRDWLFEQSK
ncbi:MAG TPA: hypothetical protein DG753_12275 [Clostridium sp.]|nr:hypothetical protein [Clostridium sp.]